MDVLEESEFEVYRQNGRAPEHILVPSSKVALENMSFSKFPWLANSYIRAVTLASSPKFNCHLTGITLNQEPLGPVAPFYAPRDKNIARISGRERSPRYNNLQFIPFWPARMVDVFEPEPIPPTDKRIAYLFHAHCWEIMCHIQGRETIEKILPDLVRAIKQFWNRLSASNVSFDKPRDDNSWGLFDHDLDYWVRILDEVLYAKYDSYVWGCDIYISPWAIPEVRAAIASSRVQKKVYKSQCTSRLPPELWLQILEFLCPLQYTQLDVQSLRSLLSVFTLNDPDSFWKARLQIHGDILLELDNLGDADNDTLDWQSLRLNLMDLLSDETWFISSGLATRKRALRFIRGILGDFQQYL